VTHHAHYGGGGSYTITSS